MTNDAANKNTDGKFLRHASDSGVAVVRSRDAFIEAAAACDLKGVIFKRDERPLVDQVLDKMGYQDLMEFAHVGSSVHVREKLAGEYTVFFEKPMPKVLEELVSDRAVLMAESIQQLDLKLTFGNLQNRKNHVHLYPFMIGALINKGTDWEIARDKGEPVFATVDQGDDFLVAPDVYHRSPPHGEEDRFSWVLRPFGPHER